MKINYKVLKNLLAFTAKDNFREYSKYIYYFKDNDVLLAHDCHCLVLLGNKNTDFKDLLNKKPIAINQDTIKNAILQKQEIEFTKDFIDKNSINIDTPSTLIALQNYFNNFNITYTTFTISSHYLYNYTKLINSLKGKTRISAVSYKGNCVCPIFESEINDFKCLCCIARVLQK